MMAPYAVLVHEAGHAVVARLLGLGCHGYNQTDEAWLALLDWSPDPRVRQAVLCGGAAAEIAVFGKVIAPTNALRGDLEEFRSWKEFLRAAQQWAVKLDLQELGQEISKAKAQLNHQPAHW